MTGAPATNPGADQRPITITAWLATDLLRVLDELRFGQDGRLPTAVRDDLDYHAGLLHVRIHRAIRAPREAIALTKRLKLPHIRRALGDLIPTAKAQRWDLAEVVRVLLAEEAAGRDAANLRTRRKRTNFPAGKTFGDWDEAASSIPHPTQDALKTLEWLTRKEKLCTCGPSGTGKSHFCEALGQAAVEAGMTVAWFTIEDLGVLVRRHRVDDAITRALARLIRTDLIIIDDIGLLPVSPDAAEGFYRLVDAAYARRALAVSSNLHPSGFDEIMPKTLAAVISTRFAGFVR